MAREETAAMKPRRAPRPLPQHRGKASPLISFHNVTVTYPDRAGSAKSKRGHSSKAELSNPSSTKAVDSFSLEVPAGSTTVLLGSSGCGKTTLLRTINRMVEPTSGEVRIKGRNVADTDPVQLRRSIGYVLQNAGLLPHKTVGANIASVMRLNGQSKTQAAQRAASTAALVDLAPELLERYPSQLSGGQQQRAGVARALAADPDILLMDEPFGAVDPIVRRSLQELLLDIQNRLGKTIVLVTHDVDEALTLADHIVLLQSGARIAQQGRPHDLLTNPANDFVRDFLGLSDRQLRTVQRNGQRIVVDQRGTVLGTLDNDSSQASTDPASTRPTIGDSTAADPATAGPTIADPATAEPTAADSTTSRPVTGEERP